jgi:hypothetical protein
MKGLLIKDMTHWCDSWSAHIATRLEILDSTYNLLIFHQRHSTDEILTHVSDAPPEIFQIIDLEETQEERSDFVSDSGTFYRIT